MVISFTFYNLYLYFFKIIKVFHNLLYSSFNIEIKIILCIFEIRLSFEMVSIIFVTLTLALNYTNYSNYSHIIQKLKMTFV